MNLFGEAPNGVYVGAYEDAAAATARSQMRNGQAGQNLVLADLQIRGYEAALMDGCWIDVVANIDGALRRLQVKATMNGASFGETQNHGRPSTTRKQGLLSYRDKIDGFAFAHLASRAVFYIHPMGIISERLSIAPSNWGRQQCEMSFNELLKRWKAS